MNQIKELLPHVLPLLPGCQPEVIFWALRAAGREFCRESGAYLGEYQGVLAPEARAVDIDVQQDAEVFRINRVFVNNRLISPDLYELDVLGHNRLLIRSGVAGKTEQNHKPDIIRIEYSMLPIDTCNEYEEAFLSRYSEAICANALSMLFAMPQKPWSSSAMSHFHKDNYMKLKAEAIEDMEAAGKVLDHQAKVIIARYF